MLKLRKIDPADQPAHALLEMPESEHIVYGTTYSIDVPDDFPDYWQARSKNLRQSIRRAIKRTDSAGIESRVETLTAESEMERAVAIHADLESRGWKGEEGSAIAEDNAQGGFYRELMSAFAASDEAFAMHLCFIDRPVASLLCIANGKQIAVLKTAYDQEYRKFCPGRQLDYYFVEELCRIGRFSTVESYTQASASDLSWATRTRDWYCVDVFRSRFHQRAFNTIKRLREALTGGSREPESG